MVLAMHAEFQDTNVKVATTRVEDGLSGHVRMHCSCPLLHHRDYRRPHQHECQRRSNQECQ